MLYLLFFISPPYQLRLYWLHHLQRGKISIKEDVLGLTLNSIWWWGLSSGMLWNMKYFSVKAKRLTSKPCSNSNVCARGKQVAYLLCHCPTIWTACILDMTLNCILWWGSGVLFTQGSEEYSFIAITLRSTLTWSCSVC